MYFKKMPTQLHLRSSYAKEFTLSDNRS